MRKLSIAVCHHENGTHSIDFRYGEPIHTLISTGQYNVSVGIFDVTKEEMIYMATELLNIAKSIEVTK